MYAERLKENRIPYKVVSVKMTVDGNEEIFYLRELSVGQKYRIYKDYFENVEEKPSTASMIDYFATLVCMTLCDKNGNLTESEEDFDFIKQSLPSSVMDKLMQAAQEVNGLTPNASEDLKKE
jgi:hypothetical protein